MTAVAALIFATTGAGCQAAGQTDPPAPAETIEQAPAAAAAKELPAVLARVNDESIERWEVETAIHEFELLNVHPIPSAERAQMVSAVLDRIIGHHLVAQEARARKLRVSDAEVDADLAQMRKEHSSDQAFETLANLQSSLEHLRRQRRLSLEIAQFVRTIIAPTVSVTDQQIDAYYRENLERFEEPDSVHASHILIRTTPGATPEEKAGARAKAAAILAQARQGIDFATLARQHSQDPGSTSEGGDLGTFVRGQMEPAFGAAAFAVKANGLSDLVETDFGFHVIKVHEHQTARTAPLSEVRSDIKELLTQRLQQEKLEAFIEQARTKARVEIYI